MDDIKTLEAKLNDLAKRHKELNDVSRMLPATAATSKAKVERDIVRVEWGKVKAALDKAKDTRSKADKERDALQQSQHEIESNLAKMEQWMLEPAQEKLAEAKKVGNKDAAANATATIKKWEADIKRFKDKLAVVMGKIAKLK